MSPSIKALLERSRLERRDGNDLAAHDRLREALALDPDDIVVLSELAILLRTMGRLHEATAACRHILARDATHASAHLGLAWIARAQGDEPAALEAFAAALSSLQAIPPDRAGGAERRAQMAAALRELDRVDEAAEIYRALLASDQQVVAAHDGLGWMARKRQDHAAALEHFRAVAERKPDDIGAQINMAKSLVALNEVPEARVIWERLVARSPRSARQRAELGHLARTWADWLGALAQFQAALEIDSGNVAHRMALGTTYYDLARWTDAEACFRQVLDRVPGYVDAMLGLAETAKARGDVAGALAQFEAIATLAPSDYRPKNAIRRLKVTRGAYDWRTEIEEAVAVARSSEATLEAQIEAGRTLVQYGLTAVAGPLLSRLQSRSPAARQLELALRQIERMDLAQPLLAGATFPDPVENQLESLQGFLEKPVPGSRTLLIVFAGTNNRTWMTFTLLHRMLRKLGVSIVYARDLLHDWYASGVVGLGEDFDSTVLGFRRLAERYRARRILTLGNCIGCHGALRFGLSLGAAGVLGFGPKLKPHENMELDHKTSLRAFRAKRPVSHPNLHTRYLAAADRPKVTLFYGEHCGSDAADARALTDIPGIVATAIPGSADPDSLKDLLVLGLLEEVLQTFVAEATLPLELHERIRAANLLGADA